MLAKWFSSRPARFAFIDLEYSFVLHVWCFSISQPARTGFIWVVSFHLKLGPDRTVDWLLESKFQAAAYVMSDLLDFSVNIFTSKR